MENSRSVLEAREFLNFSVFRNLPYRTIAPHVSLSLKSRIVEYQPLHRSYSRLAYLNYFLALDLRFPEM